MTSLLTLHWVSSTALLSLQILWLLFQILWVLIWDKVFLMKYMQSYWKSLWNNYVEIIHSCIIAQLAWRCQTTQSLFESVSSACHVYILFQTAAVPCVCLKYAHSHMSWENIENLYMNCVQLRFIYAHLPSSQTGSYAIEEPVVNVVQIALYAAAFVQRPVAPHAISRVSRAVEPPHLNEWINPCWCEFDGSFVVSKIGNQKPQNAIVHAHGAVVLAQYRVEDHESAAWFAVYLIAYGAYVNVAVCPPAVRTISFGSSMTNFAVADGWTVHVDWIVKTGVVPDVCDVIICLCQTAVGAVASSTILNWKFLNWFVQTAEASVHAVIVVVFAAVAVIEFKNQSHGVLFDGTYNSSSEINCESVASAAGRLVVARFPEKRFVARSKYLNTPAARVAYALIIYTRPERISNVAQAVGVNERGESRYMRGVVELVFARIVLSSVFPDHPTTLSMILTLNHFQTIPLDQSLFFGIVAPSVADGVNDDVVAPAAIVHLGQWDGANTIDVQAPKVPASHGEPTKDGQSFAGLYILNTVAEASWNIHKNLVSLFLRSKARPPHAACALSDCAIGRHSGLSMMSRNLRAIWRKSEKIMWFLPWHYLPMNPLKLHMHGQESSFIRLQQDLKELSELQEFDQHSGSLKHLFQLQQQLFDDHSHQVSLVLKEAVQYISKAQPFHLLLDSQSVIVGSQHSQNHWW